MLYSEFQENTGCKENEYNYKLYKRLELIYMNDDSISKAEIYEMGKKLMDNSKTEEEIKFENELKSEIGCYKEDIKKYQTEIKQYQALLKDEVYAYDDELKRHWRNSIRWCKEDIKRLRNKIASLKFILA